MTRKKVCRTRQLEPLQLYKQLLFHVVYPFIANKILMTDSCKDILCARNVTSKLQAMLFGTSVSLPNLQEVRTINV
jgi:hypothetical protein